MQEYGNSDFPKNGRIGRRLNGHLAFFHVFEFSNLKIIFTGDILNGTEGEIS